MKRWRASTAMIRLPPPSRWECWPRSGQRPVIARVREIAGSAMLAAGLDEVITYSFIGESDLDRLHIPGDSPFRQVVPIRNPLREEQGILRPLLLASLMDALNTNYKRKQTRVGLFELGAVFRSSPSPRFSERRALVTVTISACGSVG